MANLCDMLSVLNGRSVRKRSYNFETEFSCVRCSRRASGRVTNFDDDVIYW